MVLFPPLHFSGKLGTNKTRTQVSGKGEGAGFLGSLFKAQWLVFAPVSFDLLFVPLGYLGLLVLGQNPIKCSGFCPKDFRDEDRRIKFTGTGPGLNQCKPSSSSMAAGKAAVAAQVLTRATLDPLPPKCTPTGLCNWGFGSRLQPCLPHRLGKLGGRISAAGHMVDTPGLNGKTPDGWYKGTTRPNPPA